MWDKEFHGRRCSSIEHFEHAGFATRESVDPYACRDHPVALGDRVAYSARDSREALRDWPEKISAGPFHQTIVVRPSLGRAKAWNKQFVEPALNSFNIVALALECIDTVIPLEVALHRFEHAAASLALRRTEDPAGVSGPIKLESTKDVAVARLGRGPRSHRRRPRRR